MKWVSAFDYLPVNYGIQLARVADQTQRIIFHNNLLILRTLKKAQLLGIKMLLAFENVFSSFQAVC